MKTNNLARPVKFFIRNLLFPLYIVSTVSLMYLSQFNDTNPLMIQMMMFFSSILLIGFIERWMPFDNKEIEHKRADRRVNIISFVVLMGLVQPLLKVLSPLIFSIFILQLGVPEHLSVIPESWPFAIQVMLAALLAEFGQYWMHRIGHVTFFWRIHSAHHSSPRMNWLTGFRAHPLNMVYHHFAGVFLLLLIGVNETVLLTYLAISGVVNVFQHANIYFNNGPLNYIFSTNDLHRWHHSAEKEEANRNYGAVLIVWDLVFGSYYNKKGESPAQFGLFSNKNYPIYNYWKQLVAPLFWEKWKID